VPILLEFLVWADNDYWLILSLIELDMRIELGVTSEHQTHPPLGNSALTIPKGPNQDSQKDI
jgi:hypothetical protein